MHQVSPASHFTDLKSASVPFWARPSQHLRPCAKFKLIFRNVFFAKDLSPGPEKADDAYLSPHLSGFDPEVCRTKSGTFVASTIVR